MKSSNSRSRTHSTPPQHAELLFWRVTELRMIVSWMCIEIPCRYKSVRELWPLWNVTQVMDFRLTSVIEGTRRGPASHILLQLYSYYFIRWLICYIWVPREIRAKLTELDDLRRGRSKMSYKIYCISTATLPATRSYSVFGTAFDIFLWLVC
jgi:hypothetical protein